MAQLTQLADAQHYRPCDWDLKTDDAGRRYWTELFCWHLDAVLVPLIREEHPAVTPAQLAEFRADYLALFDRIRNRPEEFDRLDVLYFTELRDVMQLPHRFGDPFRGVKRRENEAAWKLLPGLLAELDAASPAAQRALLTLGLMAGNIFDLGSRATIESYRNGNLAFHESRRAQPPRPWLVDDVDAWWRRWDTQPYRHGVFFVDNAGGDLLLGCLPLVRWMLQAGARVTLAANSEPALNDITAAELEPLLKRCADLDRVLGRALAENRLQLLPTGCSTPLIDLTRLTDGFVDATRDADLIMLHGMGRSIESNYHARFTCDALHTAVLKDKGVARRLGGQVFDCVFRFRPASAQRPTTPP